MQGAYATGISYLEAKPIYNNESYLVCGKFTDTYAKRNEKWLFKDVSLKTYFFVPLREGWAHADRIRHESLGTILTLGALASRGR